MNTILKLGADWCASCRALKPVFSQLGNVDNVEIKDVNVDEDPELAAKYNVSSLPTIIFLKDEKILSLHKGSISLPSLKNKIKEYYGQ